MSAEEKSIIVPEPRAVRERPAIELPTQVMSETGAMMTMIERASRDSSVDVEKMRQLFALRKEIIAEQKENAKEEYRRLFDAAMNAAQAEMQPISVDAENKQTRSKYATYAKLDRALRPIYTKHGFALSFYEGDSPKSDHVRVFCYISHVGGDSRTPYTDMPNDGKGAKGGDVMTKTHAVGSAKSYGKRYLIRDIFNIAVGEEDNDGNGTSDSEQPEEKPAVANDVWIGLGDAAKEGEEALRKMWGALSQSTVDTICDFYPEDWAALKAKAKTADSANSGSACASKMRALMHQDKEEIVIAKEVYDENNRLNAEAQELLNAAWNVLSAEDRRAWNTFNNMGKKHARKQ